MKSNRVFTADEGAAIYFEAVLLDLAVQLVAAVIISAVRLSGAEIPSVVDIALTAAIQLVFFSAVFFSARAKKASPGIRIKAIKPWAAPVCVLLALVTVECFVVPAAYFSMLLEKIGFVAPPVELDGAASVAIFVIISVFAAPLCEELVFRGVLLGALCKKTGAVKAVLLSGLAFSLMHMNPEQTVYQFLLGSSCAWLALSSGSVLPSMLLHAGSNAFALVADLALAPAGIAVMPSAEALAASPALWVSAGIALLVCGGATVWAAGRFLVAEPDREGGALFAFGKKTGASLTAAERSAKMLAEGKADEADVAEGRRRGALFGKKSYAIYLLLGLGVCVLVWALTLAALSRGVV